MKITHCLLLLATLAAQTLAFSTVRNKVLDEKQIDFTCGYLNKHHSDVILKFAETFSELGTQKAKKNAWSGGSYVLESAKLVDIDPEGTTMKLEATIKERKSEPRQETVSVALDASPVTKVRSPHANMALIPPNDGSGLQNQHPVDDLVRRLNRLCWICDKPETTGKLIQLGIQIGGEKIGELKDNLFLNQVPHNRYVRQYFYSMAADAVLEAVVLCSQGKLTNRMEVVSMFPEMNPSMDSYRIGTLLEMVRSIAIKLVEQNLRVRICVQGSMGVGIFTGVPKQLNGVSKLLQMMDW